METAKLFEHEQRQAVQLPEQFRFEGEQVYIKHIGNAVVLLPVHAPWDVLFDSLDGFSDDFMNERNQPPQQIREDIFATSDE